MRWLVALRVGTAMLVLIGVVLAALTIRAQGDVQRAAALGAALARYAMADRTLRFDLLNARAGLLRNVDRINGDMDAVRRGLSEVERLDRGKGDGSTLDRLRASTVRQALLVERFKSDNALLQNSLARFAANDRVLAAPYGGLSANVLALTLDTSPSTVRAAASILGRIPPAPAGSPEGQLLAHGALIVTLLPELDALLDAMRAMQTERQIETLQTAVGAAHASGVAELRNRERALSMVACLLCVTIFGLWTTLRMRTRDLRLQAETERLTAAIATPLIDIENVGFPARVHDAVERLSRHLGAHRLQLAVSRMAAEAIFRWPPAASGDDWLPRLAAAADADGAWSGGQVIASRADRGGALGAAMAATGTDDLVLMRIAEPHRVTIGYEVRKLAAGHRRDHAAAIRSAMIAIANGARRELMQIERERLEQSLARARRMETVGAMASGIAHNFNNIIGAIGGFAEMGQDRTRPGSAARRSFDEIRNAADRARALVDDILNYGKHGGSAKTSLNLFEMSARTAGLLAASLRDDGAIFFASTHRYFPVLGAERDLQQAIMNIVRNGVQAGGDRSVGLSLERRSLTAPCHLSHGGIAAGDYAVLSVTDAGPGIPPDTLNRLFDPFFTTKPGGTGLGLSTAWEIVVDHGGTIDVRNVADGGARFAIWLPERSRKADPVSAAEGARVLLLADAAILSDTEERLAELGCEPIGFALSAAGDDDLPAVPDDLDAVLVVTGRSRARPVANTLPRRLPHCPLLVSMPDPGASPSLDTQVHLAYPLDGDAFLRALAHYRATFPNPFEAWIGAERAGPFGSQPAPAQTG